MLKSYIDRLIDTAVLAIVQRLEAKPELMVRLSTPLNAVVSMELHSDELEDMFSDFVTERDLVDDSDMNNKLSGFVTEDVLDRQVEREVETAIENCDYMDRGAVETMIDDEFEQRIRRGNLVTDDDVEDTVKGVLEDLLSGATVKLTNADISIDL